MKALLGSLMILATCVTLCNAYCYIMRNTKSPDNSFSECKDLNGVVHPLNSEWKTENCEKCFCGQDAIDCCSIIVRPVNYDRKKCKEIFNKENCSITVVQRKNTEETCDVYAWVI